MSTTVYLAAAPSADTVAEYNRSDNGGEEGQLQFFAGTSPSSGWTYGGVLSTSRGAAAASDSLSTVSGATSGVPFGTTTQGRHWISPPVDADFTMSGSITFNLRAAESSMSANAAINCAVYKIDGATGAVTLVHKTVRTTELGTGETAQNWSETPASGVAFKKGDRIRVVPFADDAGTMVTGFTVSLWYAGPTGGASGDSFLTFTETFGFQSTDPSTTTLYPTTASSPVGTSFAEISVWSGADENPLSEGGNWSRLDPATGQLKKVSNLVMPQDSLGYEGSYWTPANFGPDLQAYVTLNTIAGGMGIAFRVSSAGVSGSWTGYFAVASTAGVTLYRVVAAALTETLATESATWSNGDKLGVSAEGSTLKVWRQAFGSSTWVNVLSVTNTAFGSAGALALVGNDNTCAFGAVYGSTGRGAFNTPTEMWTSRGASATFRGLSTRVGWRAPMQFADFYTKQLQAFTLAGLVKVNLRPKEAGASDNVVFGAELAVCDSDGSNVTPWGVNRLATEVLTNEAAEVLYLAGDDLAVTDGQRLRLRVFVDDTSNSALSGSGTATLYYNGPTGGASGDTFLVLGQTLTEYVAVVAKVRYPNAALQAVQRAANWFRRHDGLVVPDRRLRRAD